MSPRALARPAEGDELARLRHDLRTPLAVVTGFAQLLAGERPLEDAARRDLARQVLDAAGELRALIEPPACEPAEGRHGAGPGGAAARPARPGRRAGGPGGQAARRSAK